MVLKHKPFEKLIPKWQQAEEEKQAAEETPTIPVPKEQIVISEANSFEAQANKEGLVETHLERTIAGRVDAATSPGGALSRYDYDEDGFTILSKDDELAVFVGDGAGGSGNGLFASKTAAETFLASMGNGADLMDTFEAIHDTVRDRQKEVARPMRGYLVGAAVHYTKSKEGALRKNVAACGDSKVLTIRKGKRYEPGSTVFQNLAQEMIRAGQMEARDYYNSQYSSIITTALGSDGVGMHLQMHACDHEPGDVTIIASDGLWDIVSEQEIIELAGRLKGRELQAALMDLALERGGKMFVNIKHSPSEIVLKDNSHGSDNVTVVVISS